jgi:hypothetical protein
MVLVALRPTIFDRDAAALNPPVFLQALYETSDQMSRGCRVFAARKPTTGIAACCCARAARDDATTTPSRLINSRRLI